MSVQLESGLTRLLSATADVVGAGIAVHPAGLVLTCAHVVADALGTQRDAPAPPGGWVRIHFVRQDCGARARVAGWSPLGKRDVAILRLDQTLPDGVRPVALHDLSDLSRRAFRAYGFPAGYELGRWTYGTLADRLPFGFIQAHCGDLEEGDSGAPVQELQMGRIVGLVGQVDVDRAAASVIPIQWAADVYPQVKVIRAEYPFWPLTDGLLRLPRNPLGGLEDCLVEYLGTPAQPAPFGGRREALRDLDSWLEDAGVPYLLIATPAGSGKSALLAQWVAGVVADDGADVAFVPVSQRFNTALASQSFALLGARLRRLCAPEAQAAPLDSPALWLAEIDAYLREDRPEERPLLVVLDGVDEAADWEAGHDLRFPPTPGRGVKVVVSARPLGEDRDEKDWLLRLGWEGVAATLALPRLTQQGVRQVLHAMGDAVAALATDVHIVTELHRLSQGDPLLVRLYVEALQKRAEQVAFLRPEDLSQLDPGLGAYFDAWFAAQDRVWERQGKEALRERKDAMLFLNAVACALGPLGREDLAAVASGPLAHRARQRTVARAVARVVLGDGVERGYVFSHPLLGQYFRDELLPVEREWWMQRFLAFGRETLDALGAGRLRPEQASPYMVHYYGAHLDAAGSPDQEVYALVSEGWLRAWQALAGPYGGFLSDVDRAWRRAQAACDLATQVRCALCHSSVAALGANVPPQLLARAVQGGALTLVQALTLARGAPAEAAHAEAVRALGPAIASGSSTLIEGALTTVRKMRSEPIRAAGLASLAASLPQDQQQQVLQEALTTVGEITSERERAETLASVAPHLPHGLVTDAWALAEQIQHGSARAQALSGLAPHLSHDLLAKALRAASEIHAEPSRAELLGNLAPYLPPPLLPEALGTVRTIKEEGARSQALSGLAPHLPHELTEQALAIQRQLKRAGNRARVLRSLVQAAPQDSQHQLTDEAIATARETGSEWELTETLRALGPHLRRRALAEALKDARRVRSHPLRAGALASLAAGLPQDQQEQVLQEALTTVGEITSERERAETLASVAPHLRHGLLTDAWALAEQIQHESARAQALSGLAPHLSHDLLAKALRAASEIHAEPSRAELLGNLAPYLPPALLPEALGTVRKIKNEGARSQALNSLAPHLPTQLLGDGLAAAAGQIGDADDQARVLATLAPHLPERLLRGALAATRQIRSAAGRARALGSLARYVRHDVLAEAVAAAREMEDEGSRSALLTSMAADLPEALLGRLLDEILSLAHDPQSHPSRLAALIGIAAHLPEDLQAQWLGEALAVAEEMENEALRALALSSLLPHLPDELMQQALTTIGQMGAAAPRAQALSTLALRRPEDLPHQVLWAALFEAPELQTDGLHAEVLACLAAPRPDDVLAGALSASPARLTDAWRARALGTLARHLPHDLQQRVVREAFRTARHIDSERSRADAVSALGPALPADLLKDALAIAEQMQREQSRAQVLRGLAPHLPGELLDDALRIACAISHAHTRGTALGGLGRRMAALRRLTPLWSPEPAAQNLLRVLARRPRKHLLSDLGALSASIADLAGQPAMAGIYRAVRGAGRWWP